jgi:predicted nucleic acid-binding protein
VILVDTSVWVDHLRARDQQLVSLLENGQVLAHPFVIGEIALGNLRKRAAVLAYLADLPRAIVATDIEVMAFIEQNEMFGLGVGYVDTHLLASARLTASAVVWTRDKRLETIASRLGLAL